MTLRLPPVTAFLAVLLLPSTLAAQTRGPGGTLVVAVPGEATSPVPLLWRGDQHNREVSDLMFLRLADLGPELITADERRFVPRLARKWERRDSLTLVFELDARARWQDGAPVTAADVIFTLTRARDPRLSPQISPLVSRIASVTSAGKNKVVFRFTQMYAHQFYDAVYHTPLLPSHLLAAVLPDSLATSAFVANPVGSGPYRFGRRVPGQLLELTSWPAFFLGTPGIRRVVFQLAASGEARTSMLLTGEADAVDQITVLPDPSRINALPDYRYYPSPGLALSYATFNQRDPADTSRPHPILTDRVVRQALVQAIDRQKLGRAAYGPFTQTPSAPVSAIVSRQVDAPPIVAYDTGAARQLLASRGWTDHDGDGTLDKDGRPLTLTMIVPGSVPTRVLLATQMQEAYRLLGITLRVDQLEREVFTERRNAGRFDLDIHTAIQDPPPDGLTQSWSCAGSGGANKVHYCNPAIDSIMTRAIVSRTDAPRLWQSVARALADDYPAIFLAGLVGTTAVHKRYQHVVLRPESVWAQVWQWRVKPGAEIARDRP